MKTWYTDITIAKLPIMLVGQVICSIGTGLLVMIGTQTPTFKWVIYMVLAGFGDGMCTNMPYTAIQATFADESDTYIGNAIATFATLAGGAIGISIRENILISELISNVSRYTSTISPQTVIQAGALSLGTLTAIPSILLGLREAYSAAISATMICATVAICLSIPAALGIRQLSLKRPTEEVNTTGHMPTPVVAPEEKNGFSADTNGFTGGDEGA
ncbi:hypothetical protein MMC27_002053 [Xylographa pallens]|nr:hypothetical protein [Xylographa pallens]